MGKVGIGNKITIVLIAGRNTVCTFYPCACCTVYILHKGIVCYSLVEESVVAVLNLTFMDNGVVQLAVGEAAYTTLYTSDIKIEIIGIYIEETTGIAVLEI